MSDNPKVLPGVGWDEDWRPDLNGYGANLNGVKKNFGVDDPFFILHIVIAILYFIVIVVLCIICKLKQKTVGGMIMFSIDRLILGVVAACARTGWLPVNAFVTLLLVFELCGAAILVYIMADALFWDGNQKGTRPSSMLLRVGHQIFSSIPCFLFLAGALVGQYVKTSKGQKIGDSLIITGCFMLLTVFLYLMVYMFTRTTGDLKDGKLTTRETALLKATRGAVLFLSIRLVWAVVTAFEGRREWWAQYSVLYGLDDAKSVTEFLKYGILNMLSEFIIVLIYVTIAWMLAKWDRVRRREEEEARLVCGSAALGALTRANREIGEILDGKRGDRSTVSKAVVEISAKLELVGWEKQPLDSTLRRLVAVHKSKATMQDYAKTATLGLTGPKNKHFKQAVVDAVIRVGIPAASQAVFAAHEQMLRENPDPEFADELHAALSEMTLEDPETFSESV